MIIPAAGFGTRMQGVTAGGCKELVDVGGRPAIQYALQEAVGFGISMVGIVIRKGKEKIREVVMQSGGMATLREKLQVHFFFQPQMNGECGAVMAAAPIVRGRPFLVHYPDNIICGTPGRVARRLRDAYKTLGRDVVALTRVTDEVPGQSDPSVKLSLVKDDLYQLHFQDAPENVCEDLRHTGVYIASPEFFNACEALVSGKVSREIKDSDARRLVCSRGHRVYGLDVGTNILDAGSPAGYETACRKMAGE
ncbi:MAG: NTP transferase domain-containing protein [Desulfotignum sp.]|nr:NTP transferase domain-containing protein [Desulfotignum sp.]